MKNTAGLLTLAVALTSMGVAATWSGRLLDATCRQQSRTAACDASTATVSFALDIGGRVLKFNAAGNQKALAAMKNRPDHSVNPPERAEKPGVVATVTGSEESGVIEVSSVDIR
jgi:hypothetical protein